MKEPAARDQKGQHWIISILERIVRILSSFDLEEAEIRKGEFKCRVRCLPGPPSHIAEEVSEPFQIPAIEHAKPPPKKPEKLADVVAPMTGVFYRAPAPGAPPLVEVGDKVEKGQTLFLIEAMKAFNEIPSPVEGEVVEILIQNETLVRQGEVMVKIKPFSQEEAGGG